MAEDFPTYGGEPSDDAVAHSDKRAPDVARTRVKKRLDQALKSGELTREEYDERYGAVDEARTYGSLGELTYDLAEGKELAVPGETGLSPVSRRQRFFAKLPPITPTWIVVSIITITVWLITSITAGELIYFWPLWPVGVLGAIFVAQLLVGSKDDD